MYIHTWTHTHTQTAAAYVLFYQRRPEGPQPTRPILDRSLSQSFADEGKQLKAKYQLQEKEEKTTPTSEDGDKKQEVRMHNS